MVTTKRTLIGCLSLANFVMVHGSYRLITGKDRNGHRQGRLATIVEARYQTLSAVISDSRSHLEHV